MTHRNIVTARGANGEVNLTLRRFGTLGPLHRKEMLRFRRAEQLARVSGRFTASRRTRARLSGIFVDASVIRFDEHRKLHVTKGFRPVTAYERRNE